MPQNYKKTKDRPTIPPDQLQKAIDEYKKEGHLRQVAEKYGIPKTTLARHAKNEDGKIESKFTDYGSLHAQSQIFTIQEEKLLTDYIITASKMHYGLSKTQVRELAFEFAIANNKNVSESWQKEKKAGEAWWKGFKKRNSSLTVRKPEATSLSRCTSFNKKNVGEFYDNLQSVMEKFNFSPQNIYNCDETGLTTVQIPGKVVTEKGVKQVGQVTSAERGTLVTGLFTVNAAGQFLPPFYIFPRVHFKDFMLSGAAEGASGSAHPSGWMTDVNFVLYLKHFKTYAKPSQEQPVLLIFDNHSSHISIASLNFCKDNFITLLTLPPHCSNKLQPLDVGLFGPLKTYYNAECDSWLLSHPGSTINIYQIASLSSAAMLRAFTPLNIINSFKKPGIHPFDRNVFEDADFMMASVTDRPDPRIISDEPGPSTSSLSDVNVSVPVQSPRIISPEMIRPFAKAAPRKNSGKGRKPAKTRILTDTPVKNKIIEELEAHKMKARKPKRSRKHLVYSSSENEDEPASVPFIESGESDLEPLSDAENEKDRNFEESNYVIVACSSINEEELFYVGKIVQISTDWIKINFLRRKRQTYQFVFPEVPEVQDVKPDDIFRKLPAPMSGGTARTQSFLMFSEFYFKDIKNLR